MTLSLTPAEESAGAGAALGLVGSLFFFKKPKTSEIALGTLIGAAVGYLGSQAWAAAQASSSTSTVTTLTSTTNSNGTTSTNVTSTPPTDNSNDAGGGGDSF